MREMRIHLGADARRRVRGRIPITAAACAARAGVHTVSRRSRVHQLVMRPRQISIVDEEVFFQRQLRITALEVARAIARHTVAQSEVLSAGRGTDRIGLHDPNLSMARLRVVGLNSDRAMA